VLLNKFAKHEEENDNRHMRTFAHLKNIDKTLLAIQTRMGEADKDFENYREANHKQHQDQAKRANEQRRDI